MPSTRVPFLNTIFANPIVLASGTVANGEEIANFYPLRNVGAVTLKAVSLRKRIGNPPPRIAETASGIMNAIGLANEGVDYFLTVIVPRLDAHEGAAFIANVVGDSIDDYACVAAKLDVVDRIALIELNVSCPNVHAGGAVFGEDVTTLSSLIRECKRRTRKPLIVKLPPYIFGIEKYVRAVEDAGVDAISLINTVPAFDIDAATERPIIANNFGGLSGRAILPIALRHVYLARQATALPIIGGGGVFTGEDAYKFLLAGANAVSVGTANMVDPYAGDRIARELESLLETKGAPDVVSIVGSVRLNGRD